MTPPRRAKRIIAWLAALALASLAAVVVAHFGPRYAYRLFGNWALSAVPDTLSEAQKKDIRARTQGLKARVVWSSSRSGSHEIYMLTLPELKLFRLTDNKFVDTFPRFSPDGKQLVYIRSQKPWVSQRNLELWDVYRQELDSHRETLVARGGNYPLWVSQGEVSFLRKTQVVLKELTGGREKVIYDGSRSAVRGEIQTPELSPTNRNLLALTARAKLDGVYVCDLTNGKHVRIGAGCQLGWFPDGRRLLWVDNGGRGGNHILASPLTPVQPKVFMDLPSAYSHEYFPRLSADGRWMVWAAAAKGHEHDIADYEIFLWDTTKPWDRAVRLTYSAANDNWPDIFVDK
ncbi:MAG: hypothetical protein AB1814_18945 [Thermodesulfobacteriota bacterium]